MVLIDNKTSFFKDDLVKTIEKGNKIEVVRVEGMRIVVRKI